MRTHWRSGRSYHHLHWERSGIGDNHKGLLRLPQQLRELRDVGGDPPGLGRSPMLAAIRRASVAREQCSFLEIDVRVVRAITPFMAYYWLSSPRTLSVVGFTR